jgi:hypothetical protein
MSKPASTWAASRRVAAQARERICAGRQAVEKRVVPALNFELKEHNRICAARPAEKSA